MATPAQLIDQCKNWLTQEVYPLWGSMGIDTERGGFVESVSFDGQATDAPRRAMVQARQIYSFLTGAKLGCLSPEIASLAITQGTRYMMKHFSLSSGAFIHSILPDGTPKSVNPDLYTQAFALFGLAQAFSQTPSQEIKDRAKSLVKYLHKERKVAGGGYTELDENGGISFKSNPHMHLFESAIAWMQIDSDREWKDLGEELITLCLSKFISPTRHVLGEYFDENWSPLLEQGRFIYEPGHQYEWAWLMSLYEELSGQNLKPVRHQLFLLAEKYGTSPTRKVVFDEMWSDYTPKTQSSRFWPQCERIKAAVRLGSEVPPEEQSHYAQAADESLETLFKFFQTPLRGLWYDVLSENDTFTGTSAKASSLYHIVNAMEEYIKLRPHLTRAFNRS